MLVNLLRFALYDFEMQVPNDWKLSIDRKSQYGAGIMSFSTPHGSTLDIIWENLEKHRSKSPTVEDFLNNYIEEMKKNKNVKSIDFTKESPTRTEEHESLPHEFTYVYKQPFSKAVSMKIVSKCLYCLHSNRFIIVYSRFDPKKENPDEPVIRDAIKSFDCHCTKNTKP